MCAAISWLVSRVAGTALAAASALLFLAMLLTSLYPLYITHRWDSNTFALLATVLVWASSESRTDARIFIAGLCAAAAAWITPPMFVVAIALALWVALGAGSKPKLWRFAAGFALLSLNAISVLLHEEALGVMVRTLGWDSSHYAGANRLPYGALAGTFRSFWHPGATPAALVHYSDSILPAVLPPLALIGCIFIYFRPRKFLGFLAVASFASLLACYPRFGAAQLLFGTAFFWAFCTCVVASLIPRRAQSWLSAATFILAAVAVAGGWPQEPLKSIATPAGVLQVSKRHYIQLNELMTVIKPRDAIFVYPYLPSLYFALGADNPTRYAWLQPGMMGPGDAKTALSELQSHPPHWIVWHDFTDAFILKNWPSSDRTKLHFPEMEQFFAANYHVAEPDGVVPIGYRLLEKNQ
jgi:hypothetical protein